MVTAGNKVDKQSRCQIPDVVVVVMFLWRKVCILSHSVCSIAGWSDRAGCLSVRCLLYMCVPGGIFNKLLTWSYDILGFFFSVCEVTC